MDARPDEELAAVFAALSSPTRIALLRSLQRPQNLAAIEVKAEGAGDGPNVSRQTVRKHLDVLIASGLVSERETGARGREFVVRHQSVFALAEQARGLARLRPAVETEAPTATASGAMRSQPRAPCLVVVKGLDEGDWFSLRPQGGVTRWTLGRRRESDVALDFDPYVSSANASITWDGRAHVVEDLAGSRNGTSVNFSRLATGERRALKQGDVIGVGRTLLVYWA